MAVFKNDPNAQGIWLLNNNLLDYTPNDNDLTDNNTVGYSAADKQEGTHSLDLELSNSEFASITDAAQTGLAITGDLSIGCWVKLESFPGFMYLMTKYGTTGDTTAAYALFIDASQKARLNLSPNGSTVYNCYGATTISTGSWFHIVGVYNGTDARVYVNGSLDSNGANNPLTYSSGIFDTSVDFNIGARDYTTPGYFDGLIDEAFIFDRALSATEVSDIHTNGLTSAIPLLYRRRIS